MHTHIITLKNLEDNTVHGFWMQDLVRIDQEDESAPDEMDAFLYKVTFRHKLPGPSDTHTSCSSAKNAEVSS